MEDVVDVEIVDFDLDCCFASSLSSSSSESC